MIVVADTRPHNYLIRLRHSGILRQMYGQVIAPPAVPVEMQHTDSPSEVRAWAAAPPSWLEERPVTEWDTSLADKLGMGERQAISLAIELRADVILIDELAGRQEATAWHINVAGISRLLYRLLCADVLNLPMNLFGCDDSSSGHPQQSKLICWPATEAPLGWQGAFPLSSESRIPELYYGSRVY